MLERDRIAQVYLGLSGTDSTQLRARRRINWMAHQAKGETLLDIGCSEGILPILLGREGFRVLGVDVNRDAIDFAQSLVAREEPFVKDRVNFRCLNIFDSDLPKNTFHTVFLGEIIEHLVRPERLLEAAYHFLVPGGRLVLTTPFGYFPAPDHKQTFTLRCLANLLQGSFFPESYFIEDSYIRFVGVREDHNQSRSDPWSAFGDAYMLRETEAATIRVQTQLREEIEERRKAAKSLQAKVKDQLSIISHLRETRESLGSELQVARAEAAMRTRFQFPSWQETRKRSRVPLLMLRRHAGARLAKALRRVPAAQDTFVTNLHILRPDNVELLLPLRTSKPQFLTLHSEVVRFNVPEGSTCYLTTKQNINFKEPPGNDVLALRPKTAYEISGQWHHDSGEVALWMVDYNGRRKLKTQQHTIAGAGPFRTTFQTSRGSSAVSLAIRLKGAGEIRLAPLEVRPATLLGSNASFPHPEGGGPSPPRKLVVATTRGRRSKLPGADRRRRQALEMNLVLEHGIGLPVPHVSAAPSFNSRVLHAFHSSASFDPAGYTVRSNAILRSLAQEGIRAFPCTRLGYPWDLGRHQNKPVADASDVEGLSFRHLPDTERLYGQEYSRYLGAYAERLCALADEHRVSVIHAHSNYLNGLAASLAARLLGIKSVYEMRGLWHLSRIAREPDFEDSLEYRYCHRMELAAARFADAVVAISEPLKHWLVAAGIPESKVHVVPNAAEIETAPERDIPLPSHLEYLRDRFVVGFVGSLTRYEGLDLLIHAIAHVAPEIPQVHCLIVGEGREKESLEQLAQELGCKDHVQFTGRVPHVDVAGYYEAIDVFPLPRRPYEVCKLVPPLKPLEIMAKGKAVIVSDLPPLTEIVTDGQTGLVVPPDDPLELAAAISRLYREPDARNRLADNGALWVRENRTWQQNARIYRNSYESLFSAPLQ